MTKEESDQIVSILQEDRDCFAKRAERLRAMDKSRYAPEFGEEWDKDADDLERRVHVLDGIIKAYGGKSGALG